MPAYKTAPTTEDLTGVYWARVVNPPSAGVAATWTVDRGAAVPVVGMQTLRAREVPYRNTKLEVLEKGLLTGFLDDIGWIGERPKVLHMSTRKADDKIVALPFTLAASGIFTFEYTQDPYEPYPDALSSNSSPTRVGRQEWANLVRQSRAFGTTLPIIAVAAQFSGCEIFNPAGSGLSVLVFAASCFSGFALTQINFETATLETAMALQAAQPSLLVGGAPSAIRLRASSVVPPETGISTTISVIVPAANSVVPCPNPSGLVCELSPGTGFRIMNQTVNQGVTPTVFWAEVPTASYP